jgi:hypothetical protein
MTFPSSILDQCSWSQGGRHGVALGMALSWGSKYADADSWKEAESKLVQDIKGKWMLLSFIR